MGYVQKVLQPGERLIYETNVSWISYVPGVLLLLLALIIYVVAGELYAWPLWNTIVSGVILLVSLWFLFGAWFERWTTEIAITDRRIIHKTGFIRRDTIEMSVEKVESVDVNQSLLGRMLDYGDILVRGTGAGLAPLRHIASPLAFRSKLIGTSHHLQASIATHQD
jgi:uncharacterized membrane protein YdbT with pleckstrin-like domain